MAGDVLGLAGKIKRVSTQPLFHRCDCFAAAIEPALFLVLLDQKGLDLFGRILAQVLKLLLRRLGISRADDRLIPK